MVVGRGEGERTRRGKRKRFRGAVETKKNHEIIG